MEDLGRDTPGEVQWDAEDNHFTVHSENSCLAYRLGRTLQPKGVWDPFEKRVERNSMNRSRRRVANQNLNLRKSLRDFSGHGAARDIL